MDTSAEEENSFPSNTDTIIHTTSDLSGWTQSLLSDPNITSSSSTSADYIWRDVVGCTDDLTVSVSSASSRISVQQIENVEHLNLSKAKEQVQLEELPKDLITSSRTHIKVHMQGVAVGRAVDLTVFNGYDELISELEALFDIKGELSPRIKWQVLYVDDEDGMMLVGDYPWPEFCEMARKIYIVKNLGASNKFRYIDLIITMKKIILILKALIFNLFSFLIQILNT